MLIKEIARKAYLATTSGGCRLRLKWCLTSNGALQSAWSRPRPRMLTLNINIGPWQLVAETALQYGLKRKTDVGTS
jgi:hypothetical protein